MDSCFFSVIIPVYNVEKYLQQCVDSVLAQTYENYEIILVDDGSPDNCPAICDEYQKKDSRIKVIHKENGGVSEARNTGVSTAKGDYLLFLDSDDYWDDPSALIKLHQKIKQYENAADIVIFQAKLLYPDGSLISDCGLFDANFNDMTPEQALLYMSERGLLIGSACTKAIKREFYVANKLFFPIGIRHEDIDWIIRTADCLPKYIYSDQFFYIYRKGRAESFTASTTANYLVEFFDMLVMYIKEYSFSTENCKKCLLSLIAYEFSILMAKTANLTDRIQRKNLTVRIKGMQGILKYDMHPKVRQINKVKKLLGFDITMGLLGIYLKYRKR